MSQQTQSKSRWLALMACTATALMLTACGGGGDDSSNPPPSSGGSNNTNPPSGGGSTFAPGAAQGMWLRATTDTKGFTYWDRMVVLDTGDVWGSYSVFKDNTDHLINGVYYGTVKAAGGASLSLKNIPLWNKSGGISAGNGVLVNGLPADVTGFLDTDFNGSFATTASAKNTLSVKSSSGTASWVSNYDASYDQPASLASLARSYSGRTGYTNKGAYSYGTAVITVSGGTLSIPADSKGCSASGTLAPHGTTGVFNFSLTFKGACTVGDGTAFKGIAYQTYQTANGKALEAVGTTADGQGAFGFAGAPQS